MERVQCVVAGAGVIGLAVARALSISGKQALVLEAAPTYGTGISSRNSEVVHAGLYYARNSLKAKTCVRGRHMLYDYAESKNIPVLQCGKLVVATSDAQVATLREIQKRAEENGVNDVKIVSSEDAMSMEPEIHCKKALLSPSTGIIDSHAFMSALVADAEEQGCIISFNTHVIGGKVTGSEMIVETNQGPIACDQFVNCGGLSAVSLMRTFDGFPADHLPKMYFAKGSYFKISQRPFRRLVYPVPENGGLGVHATIDLQGQVRFGPDVEWIRNGPSGSDGEWNHQCVPDIDYAVQTSRGEAFYAEVRKYWPGLQDGSLQPDYAGVRPKLQAPGAPAADFCVQGPHVHRIQGLVNLFGIESPGLTASLAVADHVVALLQYNIRLVLPEEATHAIGKHELAMLIPTTRPRPSALSQLHME